MMMSVKKVVVVVLTYGETWATTLKIRQRCATHTLKEASHTSTSLIPVKTADSDGNIKVAERHVDYMNVSKIGMRMRVRVSVFEMRLKCCKSVREFLKVVLVLRESENFFAL
jgi:hypothetical protein